MTASIETVIAELRKHFGNKKISVIEIGARYGDSSEVILKNLNIKKYYIVDPYISYDDYKDGFNDIISEDSTIYEKTRKRLKDHPVEFIRKFSDDAYSMFDDNSIDLIFVDGNHSYEYVLSDIRNYTPKVKGGGIICGDDYFMRNKKNDINCIGNQYDQDMVYEAVQEYYRDYNIEGYGVHSSYPKTWLVRI